MRKAQDGTDSRRLRASGQTDGGAVPELEEETNSAMDSSAELDEQGEFDPESGEELPLDEMDEEGEYLDGDGLEGLLETGGGLVRIKLGGETTVGLIKPDYNVVRPGVDLEVTRELEAGPLSDDEIHNVRALFVQMTALHQEFTERFSTDHFTAVADLFAPVEAQPVAAAPQRRPAPPARPSAHSLRRVRGQ